MDYFQLLTGLYLDEWNILFLARTDVNLTLSFDLLGKRTEILLGDASLEMDFYMSLGGLLSFNSLDEGYCGFKEKYIKYQGISRKIIKQIYGHW